MRMTKVVLVDGLGRLYVQVSPEARAVQPRRSHLVGLGQVVSFELGAGFAEVRGERWPVEGTP